MSPVAYTWGPFSAKIFLKIWFCKIDPLLPPHIDFNTIPYFTYGCPYRGVKEGKLKKTIAKGEAFSLVVACLPFFSLNFWKIKVKPRSAVRLITWMGLCVPTSKQKQTVTANVFVFCFLINCWSSVVASGSVATVCAISTVQKFTHFFLKKKLTIPFLGNGACTVLESSKKIESTGLKRKLPS